MSSESETLSAEETIKNFGKSLGWKVEKAEYVNIEQGIGDYQTADYTEEDPYPEPQSKYRFRIEKENASLEESYFWFLHFLKFDMGFSQIDKIYDVFSSSETSAMFGSNAQRLSIQQDKASQYLAQIGQLVKTIFPLVRELRVIDERLEMYKKWKKNKSASISLKHLYVQLVERGTENPDSVYGLAQRVGFTILPDLFMNTHVFDMDKIDEEIDKGVTKEINNVVKTVLKRKLYLFLQWKEKTEKELEARRRFQLQYMRQHWNVIKLYMSWIRPYLKTARRLERKDSFTDSADIVSGFDSNKIEIEVLAKKPHDVKKNKDIFQCILLTCTFKSQPNMSYNPQYQQQNVAHSGVLEINLRSYGWGTEDIKAYKEMRTQEDLFMLKSLDENIASSFNALGDDFEKYLREANDLFVKKSDKKKEEENKERKEAEKKTDKEHNKFKKFGPLEPFLEMGSGIGELFGGMFATSKQTKKEPVKKINGEFTQEELQNRKNPKTDAAKKAAFFMGLTYQVYKKAHRLLAW